MHKLDLMIQVKCTTKIYVFQMRHGHKLAFKFLVFALKVL